MENKVEKLKNLGEDALIDFALITFKEKKIAYKLNPEDFKITVWSNKESIIVNFERAIKYVPLSSKNYSYIYDMSINILTKQVIPFDNWFYNGNFYKPTKNDLRNIAFLKKKAILPYPGFENEVVENEDTFDIRMTNNTSVVVVSLDKVTGKEISKLNGHLSTIPVSDFLDN